MRPDTYIPTEQLVLAPWERVVSRVRDRGWASIPGVIRAALLFELLSENRWHWYPARTGQGWRAALSTLEARPAVRDLAMRLAASLSVAAELQRLPTPPLLTQVVWHWWAEPGQRLAFSGDEVGRGIAVMIVLSGTCSFRVIQGRRAPVEWEAAASDMVAFRGGGWPRPARPQPRLEAGCGQRPGALLMTLLSQ